MQIWFYVFLFIFQLTFIRILTPEKSCKLTTWSTFQLYTTQTRPTVHICELNVELVHFISIIKEQGLDLSQTISAVNYGIPVHVYYYHPFQEVLVNPEIVQTSDELHKCFSVSRNSWLNYPRQTKFKYTDEHLVNQTRLVNGIQSCELFIYGIFDVY
jgi:hypothetical protein